MSAAWRDPADVRGVPFAAPGLTPVVKRILIVTIAIFLVQQLVLGDSRFARFFADAFALVPEQWRAWFPLVPLWQLVSYGFLHGDVWHILHNMLFLYFLGTMLEEALGGRRFLVFYLVSIALAGLCQLVLGLALGQSLPIIGASGGVLAIVCAMATLRPTLRVIFIVVPLTLRTLALIYVAIDLYSVILELRSGGGGGVARFAHLSGALFGYLAVRRSWIWGDPLARISAWRERRDEEQAGSEKERLDELLAKINREGIASLTGRERAFLKRVSQRR
jgi:membrane associated rhomboid family serine protease